MNNIIIKHWVALLLLGMGAIYGQQDPQVTHYMYNTMTVNPGYAGSRGHLTLLTLVREQWLGIEGAPRTLTFGMDTPVGLFDGLGISIVQDELGPSEETYLDGNYAHQLIINRRGHKLSLGVKAGMRILSLDWSKGIRKDANDQAFRENIRGKLLPSIGAGAFYYSDNAYFGVATPNVFTNPHYDDIQDSEALERIHIFIIGGYVFEVNPFVKFKPSFFVKEVPGAPLSVDLSANMLFNESFNLGVNYRWDDSVSGLVAFQVSPKFNIGYAYDYSISELNFYNSGTHEFFLRFELISRLNRMKSPRFF